MVLLPFFCFACSVLYPTHYSLILSYLFYIVLAFIIRLVRLANVGCLESLELFNHKDMSDRNLRHKTVPVYDDDDEVQDEIDGKRKYSVEEKLISSKYDADFLVDLKGEELTFKRIQEHGLNDPIRIKDKDGLGMRLITTVCIWCLIFLKFIVLECLLLFLIFYEL